MLLTFFDMSARARTTSTRAARYGKLLDWRIVPVINENDTTTTDAVSFGDNDFLAAQVAVLVGAELLVLLTDTGQLYTADPRPGPGRAKLVDEVTDLEALEAHSEIGAATSPLGSGGMRSKVVAAEMATAAGIATVIASGLEPGVIARGVGGRARGDALSRPGPARHSSFKLWLQYAKPLARGRCAWTPARRVRCARAGRRCCPSASSTSRAASTPATRGMIREAGDSHDRQGDLQLLRDGAAPRDRPASRPSSARCSRARPRKRSTGTTSCSS